MNNERMADLAGMERGKKNAPGPVAAGRGRNNTRQLQTTPTMPQIQEKNNGPAQPSGVQRKRILARLRRAPMSTLEARQELCIMHPAARIMELRRQGYRIATVTLPNRVAKYVLLAEAGHGE